MEKPSRQLVHVPVGTKIEDYERDNKAIVLSAKDCGDHYEFWVVFDL